MVASQQVIAVATVFAASASGFAALSWKARKPRESLMPGMLPTLPVMLICGAVAILSFLTLINLLGPQL
jgi:amino acid transporter